MFKSFNFILALICVSISYAQNPYNGLSFGYPLENNLKISGNYGEIRPNHFHAGIDFTTQGQMNLPIYAVEEGYVSRIKISPYGYGKVLYITHPNGYVSVYAHQNKFCWKINQYVVAKQKEELKNEIEIFPSVTDIKIKKGELIGYTGNSGGSSGPHLHFEIREEKTEIPVNPLLIYQVPDTIKPKLTHLALYPIEDTMQLPSPQLLSLEKKWKHHDSIEVKSAVLGLGFVGFDKENTYNNPNNIYSAEVTVDGKIIYAHHLDKIDFDHGRFVNAFSERVGGMKIQRCFTPTCYKLLIYKNVQQKGWIYLNDNNWHIVQLKVTDEKGNSRVYLWHLKSSVHSILNKNKKEEWYACSENIDVNLDNFNLYIPSGTLYFPIKKETLKPIKKGLAVRVGDQNIFLNSAVKVKMKVGAVKPGQEKKYVLMNNGHALQTTFENGWIYGETKNLGDFTYVIDTIKPTIKPLQTGKKMSTLGNQKWLSYKISDGLSGIGNYQIWINGIWQIAEYDAKSDLLICYFNEDCPKGNLKIKIEVEDKSGNINILEQTGVR